MGRNSVPTGRNAAGEDSLVCVRTVKQTAPGQSGNALGSVVMFSSNPHLGAHTCRLGLDVHL